MREMIRAIGGLMILLFIRKHGPITNSGATSGISRRQLRIQKYQWPNTMIPVSGYKDLAIHAVRLSALARFYSDSIFVAISISSYLFARSTMSIFCFPLRYLSKNAGMITFIISTVLFPSIGPRRKRMDGTG